MRKPYALAALNDVRLTLRAKSLRGQHYEFESNTIHVRPLVHSTSGVVSAPTPPPACAPTIDYGGTLTLNTNLWLAAHDTHTIDGQDAPISVKSSTRCSSSSSSSSSMWSNFE